MLPRSSFPEYFHLEVHFLRESQAWTYVGEITPQILRPTPQDRLGIGGQALDTPAFNLSDSFDALVPWPEGIKPRESIPSHITGFGYSMALGEASFTVGLSIAYQNARYQRPIERALFLPACKYHLQPDGAFSRWEEHAEPFVRLGPTPPAALLRVLSTGDVALIRAAFEANADYVNRPLPGPDRPTYLIFQPMQANRMDLLELALELGADPNLRLESPVGTPLHLAVAWDRADMVARLLAAGAEPNLTDAAGETPLHRAAKQDKQHLWAILRAGGARDTADARTGLTASQMARLRELHDAIRRGDREAVQDLLRSEGQTRGSWLVEGALDGKSALLVAAQEASPEILDLIASLTKDVDRLGGLEGTRWNALHCAIAHRRLAGVEVLLRHGADARLPRPAWTVGGSFPGGQQPLHQAAQVNSRRIARVLLRHGADVDARNDARETPLIVAARHRYGRKLVELLLEKGADREARDAQGLSALDWARKWRHQRVAAALEARD